MLNRFYKSFHYKQSSPRNKIWRSAARLCKRTISVRFYHRKQALTLPHVVITNIIYWNDHSHNLEGIFQSVSIEKFIINLVLPFRLCNSTNFRSASNVVEKIFHFSIFSDYGN